MTKTIAALAISVSFVGVSKRPTTIIALAPHRIVTVTRQCPGHEHYWRKIAVRVRGRFRKPFWSDRRVLMLWRREHVTFNGITWHNYSDRVQYVVGWC